MCIIRRLLLALSLACALPGMGLACTSDDFRTVVDAAGAALRKLNAESQPRIEAAMRRLRDRNGWAEAEFVERANELISDDKSIAYDEQASDLLARLDKLAESAYAGTPDCSRLGELQSTASELQATVRVKTQYLLARLESLGGGAPQRQAATEAPAAKAPAATAPAPQTSPTALAPPAPPPAPQAAAPLPSAPVPSAPATPTPAAQPKAPPTPKSGSQGSWTTSTVESPVRGPSSAPAAPLATPPASAVAPTATDPTPTARARRGQTPMPPLPTGVDGFSIDEIQEASQGFFGTISGGLAGVIEHAFSKLGRPAAYVLGNEGGGAFIAGVRYGHGTLYMRDGRTRKVYWHGPSIGTDIGAAGAKTLFLVYGLAQELDIFAGFTGVDGQAYLVGGVGMTVLTDGKVVMVPIRSGVGLRLGASVGYLRFTPRATWNPF